MKKLLEMLKIYWRREEKKKDDDDEKVRRGRMNNIIIHGIKEAKQGVSQRRRRFIAVRGTEMIYKWTLLLLLYYISYRWILILASHYWGGYGSKTCYCSLYNVLHVYY